MADHWTKPAINKNCVLLGQRLQRNPKHHESVGARRDVHLTLGGRKESDKVLAVSFAGVKVWGNHHTLGLFSTEQAPASSFTKFPLKGHCTQDTKPFWVITTYTACSATFKDFHRSLGLIIALAPGIHHHQHTRTRRTKQTHVETTEQNSSILKEYVYKGGILSPFFPEALQDGLGRARPQESPGHVLPSSDNLGRWHQVPSGLSLSGNLLWPQRALTSLQLHSHTRLSCLKEDRPHCWLALAGSLIYTGDSWLRKHVICDTLTCQSPPVDHTVSFTLEGFILLVIIRNYLSRVKQYSLAE